MTEPYDTKTMRAIIAEAKRQGFDDREIAIKLNIGLDDQAFGYGGDDQLRARIRELRRRGIHHEGIAERMGLTLAEFVAIEGDPGLRVGLDGWAVCRANPDADHHEDNILRLIERGRGKLATDDQRLQGENEALARLVDASDLAGAHAAIAEALRRTGDVDIVAETLRIPLAAAKAVAAGSFPAPSNRTLQ